MIDNIEPELAEQLEKPFRTMLRQVNSRLRDEDLSRWSRARYNKMRAWLQAVMRKQYGSTFKKAKSFLTELAETEFEIQKGILSFSGMSKRVKEKYDFPFSDISISPAKAKAIVDVPVGGKLLEEYIMRDLGETLALRIQGEVTQGILQGEPLRLIRDRLEALGGINRTLATTIGRTYTASVANRAHDLLYESNKTIIKGRIWRAVFDNRTCIRCAPLDGQEFWNNAKGNQMSIDDMPPLPLHARCRCLSLPIVKSVEKVLGIKGPDVYKYEDINRPFSIRARYKDGPRGGRGAPKPVHVGGAKIVEAGEYKGSFERWMRRYPEAARDILGKKRYALWNSGEVKLKDMMGRPGVRLTLDEIRAKAG